jgi:hypothetical protein
MSSVNFACGASVGAAIITVTPTATAMRVQTTSAYAFEVRIRFIVMSVLVSFGFVAIVFAF